MKNTRKSSGKMKISAIDATMNLRTPQYESLKILDEIMRNFDLSNDLKKLEKELHEKYPAFREFEREFPSLTFSLATGVGKTILMGSFITYLYMNYGMKNFFIVAPNLTVYNKLIKDFGDQTFKKYLFKRIPEFRQMPPKIITGDNYENVSPYQSSFEQSININIFNISKINSDTKEDKGGKNPKIKRLNEVLGESYFEYLSGLTDLVLLMDESHHYRAAKGLKVLNELDPILGLELTATPQVENGNKEPLKFKNVVYEYSLANAIRDGYVKVPAVATRRDFDSSRYDDREIDNIKLQDGLFIHRKIKKELEVFAINEEKKIVKPFVLIVCRDTTHSAEVKNFICSDKFYNGEYKDKVIELHSNLKGDEKDENIQQLLSLEDENNNIEVVVHVNMLKEGWDVTNLYTIIPLRIATSMTLREQTIGRGLRLPYGEKTGNKYVDTLNIVAHDNFNKIIEAANDPNSIIQKENIIVFEDDENFGRETQQIQSVTKFNEIIREQEKQLEFARTEEKKEIIKRDIEATKIIDKTISEFFEEQSREAITSEILKEEETKKILHADIKNKMQNKFQMTLSDSEIEKKIEFVVEVLAKSSIDIPEVLKVTKGTPEITYQEFKLNADFLSRYSVPSEEIWIQNLQNKEHTIFENEEKFTSENSIENILLEEIIKNDPSLDYDKMSDYLYNLITEIIRLLSRDNTKKDTSKIIEYYKKEFATKIISEINSHKKIALIEYEVKIITAKTPILSQQLLKFKDDEIIKYNEIIKPKDIKNKVFGEFKKACHNQYKFDSEPEQRFTIVLENSNSVEKWLRPASKQFKILWNNINNYEPDFVVETKDSIYIIEIKGMNSLEDVEVKQKANKAREYCDNVNVAFDEKAKKWSYILLGEDDFSRTSDFSSLIGKSRE